MFNSVSGFLSDRFGRRSVVLYLSSVHVLASWLTYLSSYCLSFPFFLGVREEEPPKRKMKG